MSATRLKLEGFDALRALAALTVVSYHVARSSTFGPAGWLAPLLWELKGGVAIFFVISGALLYLPYARAIRDGRGLPDWRRYGRRRGARILPAYWLTLTALAIGPFAAGGLGPDAWRYYGLSQIYNSQTVFGGLGVAWSLCVEVSFYAVLPLFAWWVARRVRRHGERSAWLVQVALIAAAGLASLALRGALAGSLIAPVRGSGKTLMVALPGLLDWFAIGMSLAVLRAELEAGRASKCPLAVLGARPRLCALLALAAFLAGVPAQHGDVFLPWYGLLTHVAVGLGSGLLVLAVIVPRAARAAPVSTRVLGSRALAWVGTISYGIYLWHLPLLGLIGPALLPGPASATLGSLLALWLAGVGGALVLGAASWYLVERPVQRVLRRREQREDRLSRLDAPALST